MLFTYQQAAQLNIQNRTIEMNVSFDSLRVTLFWKFVFASEMIVCVQTTQVVCNV